MTKEEAIYFVGMIAAFVLGWFFRDFMQLC